MDERFPIARCITFFGQPCVLTCDAKCSKAWGINVRPKVMLGDFADDYIFVADEDLGSAPTDPGTYEGGFGKPQSDEERLNKWCARECERSSITRQDSVVSLRGWVPKSNIPCTKPSGGV